MAYLMDDSGKDGIFDESSQYSEEEYQQDFSFKH